MWITRSMSGDMNKVNVKNFIKSRSFNNTAGDLVQVLFIEAFAKLTIHSNHRNKNPFSILSSSFGLHFPYSL